MLYFKFPIVHILYRQYLFILNSIPLLMFIETNQVHHLAVAVYIRVVFSSSVVYFHWLYFLFFLLITCKSAQRADGIVKKQGRAGKNIFFTYTTNTVLKYNSISPGFFSVPAGHQVLPTKQIYRKTVKSKLIGIITPAM